MVMHAYIQHTQTHTHTHIYIYIDTFVYTYLTYMHTCINIAYSYKLITLIEKPSVKCKLQQPNLQRKKCYLNIFITAVMCFLFSQEYIGFYVVKSNNCIASYSYLKMNIHNTLNDYTHSAGIL